MTVITLSSGYCTAGCWLRVGTDLGCWSAFRLMLPGSSVLFLPFLTSTLIFTASIFLSSSRRRLSVTVSSLFRLDPVMSFPL
jgi:hypothetical protein